MTCQNELDLYIARPVTALRVPKWLNYKEESCL